MTERPTHFHFGTISLSVNLLLFFNKSICAIFLDFTYVIYLSFCRLDITEVTVMLMKRSLGALKLVHITNLKLEQ